jgi:hypothetical protein
MSESPNSEHDLVEFDSDLFFSELIGEPDKELVVLVRVADRRCGHIQMRLSSVKPAWLAQRARVPWSHRQPE